MSVGQPDYDWSYATVCPSRRVVILLTLGPGPATKSTWSQSTLLCVRDVLFYTLGHQSC